MELSERKRRILRAAIEHYVREVRPVSSQQLADGEGLSSATLRHELHSLEEQGYLRQLHTSGGRIPTDRAYRFFVEELISHLTATLSHENRVQQVYSQLAGETEALLQATLDLLTSMTGGVAWVSMPAPAALDIRSLSFVEVDTHSLLLVLVTADGALQSRLVHTEVPVVELHTGRLSEALNNYLRGRSVVDVDHSALQQAFRQTLNVPESLMAMLEDFLGGLARGPEKVVFGNALRLVLQPEFTSAENLSGVLSITDDKERFVRQLRTQLSLPGLQTIIGSENHDESLQQCSLVVSRYSLPGGLDGTVGVIGPTRQDYERTLSWVKVIGEAVARALSEIASAEGRRR